MDEPGVFDEILFKPVCGFEEWIDGLSSGEYRLSDLSENDKLRFVFSILTTTTSSLHRRVSELEKVIQDMNRSRNDGK